MRSRGTLLIAPTAAGLIAALLVYVGDRFEWEGFSGGTGYLGTHFLDSVLYAMGNYAIAMLIVAGLWFTYAFIICAVVELWLVCVFRPQWLARTPHPTETVRGFPVVQDSSDSDGDR